MSTSSIIRDRVISPNAAVFSISCVVVTCVPVICAVIPAGVPWSHGYVSLVYPSIRYTTRSRNPNVNAQNPVRNTDIVSVMSSLK